MRTRIGTMIVLAGGLALFASQSVNAQTAPPAKAGDAAKPKAAPAKAAAPKAAAATSAAPVGLVDTIKAGMDELGMLRQVNRQDAINTMEFWASGNAGDPAQVIKSYHVMFAYNPQAMRVEEVRTNAKGGNDRTIRVFNDKYAWDESEIGAGLDDTVKGTVTPKNAEFAQRSLQLWVFPYGALKAAMLAGSDNAQMSKANGATIITFPLTGKLAGVTESVTLGPRYLVTKVETKSSDPNLTTETDYSDYADLGDIKSDVKFPGHIVRKVGGKEVLDIHVSKDDPNNPYLVFPTPGAVMKAGAE
jgi:hypothetical protein